MGKVIKLKKVVIKNIHGNTIGIFPDQPIIDIHSGDDQHGQDPNPGEGEGQEQGGGGSGSGGSGSGSGSGEGEGSGTGEGDSGGGNTNPPENPDPGESGGTGEGGEGGEGSGEGGDNTGSGGEGGQGDTPPDDNPPDDNPPEPTPKFTVVFMGNGGTPDRQEIQVDQNTSIADIPTVDEREHYEFNGWYDSPDGGNNELRSSTIITQDMTYYANWMAETMLVLFNPMGGSHVSETKYVPYMSEIGELPTPTKDGREFLGWFTEETGGEKVTPETVMSFDENLVVYAHWSEISIVVATHRIVWNSDGGNAIPDSIVRDGDRLIDYIPDPPPSCEGRIFEGWYFADNMESGLIDQNDTTLLVRKDRELKALWIQVSIYREELSYDIPDQMVQYSYATEDLVTMVFDEESAGQQISPFQIRLPEGDCLADHPDTFPLREETIQTPHKEGYEFIGWWTTPEIGGEKFTVQTKFIGDQYGRMVMYARWVETPAYTVTFDANGWYIDPIESQTTTQKQVRYFTQYGEMPDVNWRDGYVFVGWFTDPEDGVEVTSDTKKMVKDNETLYAHWVESPVASSPNMVTVTFLGNGGIPSVQYGEFLLNDSMAIVAEATREHFLFDGWWTTRGEGGERFGNDEGDNRVLDETLRESPILYAHWTPDEEEDEQVGTLPLTFDPNGGTMEQTTYRVLENRSLDALPTTTWDDNHEFQGWWSDKRIGYGIHLTTNKVITPYVSSLTWYAQWKQLRCNVTFEEGNGTYCMPVVVDYGTKVYDMLPRVYRWGYEFLGWFLDNREVTSETTITQDTVIDAHWRKHSEDEWNRPPFDDCDYVVTLNTNGGTQNGGSIGYGQSYVKVNLNQPYGELPNPTWEGHIFVGWSIYRNEDRGYVTSDTIVAIPDHHTLFGHWTKEGVIEPDIPPQTMLDDPEIQQAFAEIDQQYPIPNDIPVVDESCDGEIEEESEIRTSPLIDRDDGIGYVPITPDELVDVEFITLNNA